MVLVTESHDGEEAMDGVGGGVAGWVGGLGWVPAPACQKRHVFKGTFGVT